MKEFIGTVDSVLETLGIVIISLPKSESITLSDHASLNGFSIQKWMDVPRVLDHHGNLRMDLFGFSLKDKSDAKFFEPGQKAKLIP